MQRILVAGATGHTGSLIVQGLKARGANVCALVREPERAAELQQSGIETVIADMDDPATLPAAMGGADRIYLVTWNGPTAEQQRKNMVDAARSSGRPHVVVGGALGPPSRIIRQIDAGNDYLKASGLPWTILQPTFFMQNLLGARGPIAQGKLYLDLGEGRLPTIDIRDIADSAVAVLTGDGHVGRTYTLTGPAAITGYDMAAALSRELGHEVTYVPVPTEAGKQFLVSLGYSEWIADGFGELLAGFAQDWAADRVSADVQRLTGHPARSFQQFAHDFSSYFLGQPIVEHAV